MRTVTKSKIQLTIGFQVICNMDDQVVTPISEYGWTGHGSVEGQD
jgi:hypothetical protein